MDESFFCSAAARADTLLRRAERVCSELSAFMLAAIMVIVVLDVGCRYLLNSPLVWSFDVITLYLTVGLFFFAISDTLQDNSHVWVDVVVARMPPRWQHASLTLAYAISWLAFAAIAWMEIQHALVSFERHEVSAGMLKMPVWISPMFVSVGLVVLLGRIGFRTLGNALSAIVDRPLIALPGSHDIHTGVE